MTGTWAVVVAAGEGARFGGMKQFAPLGASSVTAISVRTARSVADGLVLVVPRTSSVSEVVSLLGEEAKFVDSIVTGGATRAESVRAGLAALPPDVEVVVVHDAARPLASTSLFKEVIRAVADGADAAIPAIAVTDTLKQVQGDVVVSTVSREGIVSVQTPQAFRADLLRRAHAGSPDATDDAALVEALGATVRVVPGESSNLKLTEPADLALAEALLASLRQ
jgi:2-C-methyl-D-erythritol 4-phosphate cytidylyltransferase